MNGAAQTALIAALSIPCPPAAVHGMLGLPLPAAAPSCGQEEVGVGGPSTAPPGRAPRGPRTRSLSHVPKAQASALSPRARHAQPGMIVGSV